MTLYIMVVSFLMLFSFAILSFYAVSMLCLCYSYTVLMLFSNLMLVVVADQVSDLVNCFAFMKLHAVGE